MPIYEYVCSSCGRRIDVMHGIHGHGPATCEACGGAMKKALTAPAIHFKGSGWAKKDARSSTAPVSTAGKTEEATAPAGDAAPAAPSGPATPATPSTAPATSGSGPAASTPGA